MWWVPFRVTMAAKPLHIAGRWTMTSQHRLKGTFSVDTHVVWCTACAILHIADIRWGYPQMLAYTPAINLTEVSPVQSVDQLMWHYLCRDSLWGMPETINATIETRMTNTSIIGYGSWYAIWVIYKKLDDPSFSSSSCKNFLIEYLSLFLCLQDVLRSIPQVPLNNHNY